MRREVRRRAREIRRGMDTPEPVYLTGDAPEAPRSRFRGGGPVGPGQVRRTRWKLVVATLPLASAAVLLVLTVTGVGPFERGADEQGPVEATDADHAADTAVAAAGALAEVAEPTTGIDSSTVPTSPTSSTATAAVAPPAPTPPTPPEGHQAVAIRFAAPDAVDLAVVGDVISVVGIGGDVLTSDAEVLQDRSTPQASVLVVAVPVAEAPAVAAAALAQDLTLLVTPSDG